MLSTNQFCFGRIPPTLRSSGNTKIHSTLPLYQSWQGVRRATKERDPSNRYYHGNVTFTYKSLIGNVAFRFLLLFLLFRAVQRATFRRLRIYQLNKQLPKYLLRRIKYTWNVGNILMVHDKLSGNCGEWEKFLRGQGILIYLAAN